MSKPATQTPVAPAPVASPEPAAAPVVEPEAGPVVATAEMPSDDSEAPEDRRERSSSEPADETTPRGAAV